MLLVAGPCPDEVGLVESDTACVPDGEKNEGCPSSFKLSPPSVVNVSVLESVALSAASPLVDVFRLALLVRVVGGTVCVVGLLD